MRHRRRHRLAAGGTADPGFAAPAGISRLRQRRHRHAGQRPHRAPPRRGQARQSRRRAGSLAADRHDRHRPHALGDAWRADREQRASARHLARVDRAQRHHREPRRTARRTRGGGPGVQHRDRHRDGGATGRSEPAARHGSDRGGGRGVPPAGRRLCAGDDLLRPSRTDRRRAARRAAGGGLRRGRDVRRLRRPGAGAADPAHRLSERRRLDGGRSQGRALLRHERRRSAARGEADAADRRGDRQGQLPPLHGKGTARASRGDRRHAASHGQPVDARGGPARSAVRFRHAAAHHHQRLRQRVTMPVWSGAGGSRRSPASRPTSMSPASSATARRRWRRAGSASWSASRARPPIPWRRCATCASSASTCCRS